MQAEIDEGLARTLADIERPRGGEMREGGSPLTWLLSRPRLHRLLPDRLALALGAALGRALWLHRPSRDAALASTRLVLAGTPREAELKAIAPRWLRGRMVREALHWRPWMHGQTPVEDAHHIARAQAGGRGAILLTAHVGFFIAAPLIREAGKLYIVAGEWMDHEQASARHGAVARRRAVEAAGSRYVTTGRTFDALRALLERGETLYALFDSPGSTRVELAGKEAHVRSGLARLACETGAPIVPVFAREERRRPVMRAHPPIDPGGFSDWRALTDRLAALVSEEIVRAPELYANPGFAPLLWPADYERLREAD